MKVKNIIIIFICLIFLSSCAAKPSVSKSIASSSEKYSSSALKAGDNEWFMKEYINDLELVLGIRNFDSTKNLLEDELCLFAYMKLEGQKQVDNYYNKDRDCFIIPENIIDDIITQYFGNINIHKSKYYKKDTKVYELGAQSFGSITCPEIAKKETLPGGRTKILVNNINPDLPEDKRVVIARTYIFEKTGSQYVLKSTKVEAYNPPEN